MIFYIILRFFAIFNNNKQLGLLNFNLIGDIIFIKLQNIRQEIHMKRLSVILASALILTLLLCSCASDTFVLVYYENYKLMSDAVSFTVEKVPEEEHYIIFGAMDGELGQIEYEVHDDAGEPIGTLVYRMATLEYADKYESETGGLGISGKAGAVESTERLGSYTVSYRTDGNVAIAVWEEDEYAYSVVFTFTDEETEATTAEVRTYAISLIATR